ncbi:TonB-dependent receptor domain-containing protein [Lysobacter korlensis]|uniref:TonB-dependent receptor domain-containing protein n=1 Tax=Lysobacter korlensis TaxID=553636 RepID=A0ABV6S0J4_9GAMM
MSIKTSRLRDAITFALVVGATSAIGTGAALAQAQEAQTGQEEAATLDTVVVTGTRIQSQTVTASSPVAEIQSEEFQYTGSTRVEDLVNQYPQLSPNFDSFENNGATGYATVSLRGLGASRTLTLVNGFRLPPGAFEVRDISIVPAALVSRVDILTGGASAVYGSDAIVGVVNFILDDEFEGVSLSAGYSAYQHDNDNEYIQGLQAARGFPSPDGDSGFDGISRNIDLVVGGSFADGAGHATAWATWRQNDPLFQGQRDYAACALSGSGLACGGSNTNAAGNFYFFQQGAGVPGGFRGTNASLNPDGSFRTGYGAPYNFAPINYYQRPDERYTFGSTIKYEVNEHFRPYLETMFVNKRSSIQVAESGAFFTALTLDCANPILGSACADLGFVPGVPLNTYVAKRNVEGGPRRTDDETNSFRVVAGVEGDLGDGWAYNASYLYAATSSNVQGFNDFLSNRIVSAILGCPVGNTFTGCIPYNVFVPGGVTPEAAAALSGTSFDSTQTTLKSINAFISGDTGVSLPWVADGNINVVFGTEWREETYNTISDIDSQNGNFAGAGGPSLPLSGEISVSEIFMEAAVPLLRDTAFVEDLTLDLGYRLSDYDRSGRANTWKVGLNADLGEFRVRTGYNHAIRAPGIGDLFDQQQIALYSGVDPCAGANPILTPQQCLNTGVPLDRYGTVPSNTAGQNNQFIGGNPNLQPEEGDTFTFGVVYNPTASLQLSADYFDIKIEETIGAIGADTILQFCARTGDPFLCSRVQRNPVSFDLFRGNDATSGRVVNLDDNFGEIVYRGIDLGANYRWEMLGGRFSTSFNGTYLMEEERAPLPGVNEDATFDCAGKISPQCQSYKWRHIASLRYARDFYTVNLGWRYFGALDYENDAGVALTTDKLICENVGTPGTATCRGDGEVGAFNYIDLSASAFIGQNTEITLGVNNIADKEPPLVGSTLATNGNAVGGYDQAGRYFFGSISFKF